MGDYYWNWRKIRESDCYSEIERVYTGDFPIEVRCLLTSFLAADTSFLNWDPDNPSNYESISEFICRLKTTLGKIFNNLPIHTDTEYFYKKGLRAPCERIQNHDNDLQLFQIIWKSLTNEQRLLHLSRPECEEEAVDNSNEQLFINSWKAEIDGGLATSEKKCEDAVVRLTEIILGYGTMPFLVASPEEIQREVTRLEESLQTFGDLLFDCLQSLESLRTKILFQLNAFKDKQRFVPLAIRPKEQDEDDQEEADGLQDFEEWFQRVAHCLSQLEGKLEEFEKGEAKPVHGRPENSFGWAKNQIAQLRNDFLRECPIIQKQPAQIIRNQNNFGEVVLRLLPFSSSTWNIDSVKALFVNRDSALQVAQLRQSDHFNQAFLPQKAPGQLTCDPVFPDTENTPSTRKGAKQRRTAAPMANVIRFPNVRVKKVVKGRENRKSESVIAKKYWMYFRVGVKRCNDQIDYFHVLSQPLCTTTHTSQEAKAWASLMWFNAFPLSQRTSNGIDVPTKIQAKYLIEVIDQEFVHLGGKLSEKQKAYLRGRMVNGKKAPESVMVRKSQFCKLAFPHAPPLKKVDMVDAPTSPSSSGSSSPLASSSRWSAVFNRKRKSEAVASTSDGAGRDKPANNKKTGEKYGMNGISFGEWLYYCINILNPNIKKSVEVLSKFWKEGKIMGFIESQDIQDILLKEPAGTFMIRFPENRANRLGLYFYSEEVKASSASNECLLKFLYKLQDFHLIPLEERILMNKAATFVYSDALGEQYGRNSLEKSAAFEIEDKENDGELDERGYFKAKIREYFSGVFQKKFLSARHMMQRMSVNKERP